MSEVRGITKFQLVQMFGELELYITPRQRRISADLEEWGYFTQAFSWNGVLCQEIVFEEDDYPELTVHIIKEVCAGFILNKIGKAIEVQL